jgi:hypothetical protein
MLFFGAGFLDHFVVDMPVTAHRVYGFLQGA